METVMKNLNQSLKLETEEQNLILSRELNRLLKNYLKDMNVNVKSGFNIKLSSRSAKLKKLRAVTEAFNQARQPLEKTSSKRLDNTVINNLFSCLISICNDSQNCIKVAMLSRWMRTLACECL